MNASREVFGNCFWMFYVWLAEKWERAVVVDDDERGIVDK